MIGNHNATSDVVNIFRLQLQCVRGLCFPGYACRSTLICLAKRGWNISYKDIHVHVHVSDFEALAQRF